MNFYSRTKPTLVSNLDNNTDMNILEELPVKDIVTSYISYLYQNFIKDNFIWILMLIAIVAILYYRSKKPKTKNIEKEEFNEPTQHLATLNPLQRTFTGKVQSLPNEREMVDPEPYPAMNHTPYNVKRAWLRTPQYTGVNNPYAYYPDSTINNYAGNSPDYLSTTSSFGKYYTDNSKQTVLDLRRLMTDRDQQLQNNLNLGPDALPSVKDFEPPYASI